MEIFLSPILRVCLDFSDHPSYYNPYFSDFFCANFDFDEHFSTVTRTHKINIFHKIGLDITL